MLRKTKTMYILLASLLLIFTMGVYSPASAACTDNDGDGYGYPGDASCPKGSKTDCDDSDPKVYPGAAEICDGKDSNCDGWKPATDIDKDSDGVPMCKNDCNDNDPTVYPGAAEICDGKDNNCDYRIPTNEKDLDGDGYLACGTPADCNDNDPYINPGIQEWCSDGKDNNCNSQVDETPCICPDADNDGFTASYCGGTDCVDTDNTVYPGAPELCTDGKDNDCNGLKDCSDPNAVNCPPITDADGDGYDVAGICGTPDCDDSDPKVYPGAPEICDGKDSNCDGWKAKTDVDADGDGVPVCAGDCNDNNPNINPLVLERHIGDAICSDGIDNDCDGRADAADSGCAAGSCNTKTSPKDSPHFFTLLNPDGSVHQDNNTLNCGKCHAADFNDPIRFACQRCHADPADTSDPLNGVLKVQYPLFPPYGYGSAPNVAMHSSENIGTRYGNWNMGDKGCVTCHNPHAQEQNNLFGTDYGMFIKEYVCFNNPVTGLNIQEFVEFTSDTGPGSFADGPRNNENICEMCHTQTKYHRRDGTSPTHYDGDKCTNCHVHESGFKPSCGACHAVPPPTGTHAVHFGGTKDDASYGSTSIAQDVTPQGTAYLMNCGNCHPMDGSHHINGVSNSGGGSAEIELYNPNAPAGSLKSLSPNATYTPGTTLMTDANGLTYTVGGTCSNVYCHSGPMYETVNPLTGAFPAVIPDPTPGPNIYPLVYSPAWEDFVVTSRLYQSPSWGVDSLGCNGCHGYPIQNAFPDVSAGAGDSHAWIDDYGYINLHVWNMGFDPVQCSTCHNDTVKDPFTWTRDDFSIQLGNISIFNKSKHVNGSRDVAFTSVPVPYNKYSGTVYKDLSTATYDANTKNCSNVECHINQTPVKWGSPYRWWNGFECNSCHQM
ncbi:MAG: MopE-related protein [Nitrospirota bacterium]